MPVETGGVSVVPQTVENLDKRISYDPKDPAWQVLVRQEKTPAGKIDDEFHPQVIPILKPLDSITVERINTQTNQTEVINLDKDLEKQFSYLSRTRKLEVGTAKTKVLQDIVDKMTQGSDIKARLVVMDKGTVAEAFTYIDGTIFVSQSLLNALDSLDEIGGVLAHELGHLINKSSENAIRAGSPSHQWGIGWIHETAADAVTMSLLVRAKLNSMAAANAIQKLSESNRGASHQTGYTRASEIVGAHGAKDYPTSNKPHTAKPEELKSEALRTNFEMFEQILKAYQEAKKDFLPAEMGNLLRNLHPEDFDRAYSEIRRMQNADYLKVKFDKLILLTDGILKEKMTEAGLDLEEQLLFLLCKDATPNNRIYLHLFEDPDTLVNITSNLAEINNRGNLDRASQMIFMNYLTVPMAVETLVKELHRSMYDINIPSDYRGYPVNRESILEIISNIQKFSQTSGAARTIGAINAQLLTRYAEVSFLRMAAEAGAEVDEDQLRKFFQEAKDLGITVDSYTINHISLETSYKVKGETIWSSAENGEAMDKAFREVFGLPARIAETAYEASFEKIDEVFLKFAEKGFELMEFGSLMRNLRQYFDGEKISDQERAKFINYISEKIDSLDLKCSVDLLRWLDGNSVGSDLPLGQDDPRQVENSKLRRFNLKSIVALSLFTEDGPIFYEYMQKTMSQSGINTSSLTPDQLINLCQGLLEVDSDPGNGHEIYIYHQSVGKNKFRIGGAYGASIKITNYENLYNLLFLREIISRQEPLSFQSFSDLNSYVEQRLAKSLFRESNRAGTNLYGDSPFALIFGRQIRENFQTIIQNGISDSKLGDLYKFIDLYYPEGTFKTQSLREINKRYLRSKEVSLAEKTDYLTKHFGQIGFEGMAIVAEQIEDFESYIQFRNAMETHIKSYLSGSREVTFLALADYLTSFLTQMHTEVLATCNPKTGARVSTNFAVNWFDHYLNDLGRTVNDRQEIEYDQESGKFVLGGRSRIYFQTIADSFASLRQLTNLQRFAIAHKLLTDRDGAFSSAENRTGLAQTLTTSLGLKDGFINAVLKTACEEGDPKFIGFPAANMLAPLLFRALNVDAINLKKVGSHEVSRGWGGAHQGYFALDRVVSAEDLKRLAESGSREVIFFGAEFKHQPDSFLFQLAQQSDSQYYQVRNTLSGLLAPEKSGNGQEEEKVKIDPAMEAIISGVEASGAIGVRALQLLSQLTKIEDPNLQKRLSQTLDQNPGLNKLTFWENLYDLSLEDPRINEMLRRIRLGGYLGGGSLYTTYEGILVREDGLEEEVVLKMLKPNAETFIEESYKLAKGILGTVGKRNRKFARFVKKGLLLLNLSRDWCLADINDPTFEVDDDDFKNVVRDHNVVEKGETFGLPDRRLNARRLKIETKARGATINGLLKDADASYEVKKTAVENLGGFFVHQLRTDEYVTTPEGKKYKLVHSDPHIGNYIIDTSTGQPRIKVIDRHMYLRLEDQDISLVEKFIRGGNINDLLYSFTNRILDLNGRTNPIQRRVITASVFTALGAEYTKQMVSGGIDRIALLNTLLTQFSERDLEVPLNLRLMIRNVEALRELMAKFNLRLETL